MAVLDCLLIQSPISNSSVPSRFLTTTHGEEYDDFKVAP